MMVLGCNILDGSTKADSWAQHTSIGMEDCVIEKENKKKGYRTWKEYSVKPFGTLLLS